MLEVRGQGAAVSKHPALSKEFPMYMFKAIMGKYFKGMNYMEFMTAAYIGYCKALKSFKRTKKASLKTWVHNKMYFAILDELRALSPVPRTQYAAGYDVPISVEDMEWQEIADNGEPVECWDRRIDAQKYRFKAARHRFGFVMDMLEEGMTQRQIGEEVGVSESRVSQYFWKMVHDLRLAA